MSFKKMVSVSLNQVKELTTTDHGLILHRQKVANCVIVGNVLSINEQSTKTIYTFTDYTGPAIEVSCWKKTADEDSRMQQNDRGVIMEQTYAKAFGQPRKDANGSVFFVAFHIQPLENLNELTIHLLEIILHSKDLAMLKNDHINKGQSDGGSVNGNKLVSNNVPKISGFNDLQSMIMNVIKMNTSDIGIDIEEIYASIRTAKRETIKETVDFLLNEGHIYEALDETHFKSSD